MLSAGAAFLKTLTGKTVAGLVLASSTAVGAAAAGAPVPVVDQIIQADSDESSSEALGYPEGTDEYPDGTDEYPDGTEESGDESTDGTDESCTDDAEGTDEYPEGTEESGDESTESDDDCEYKNHGEKVSTFTQTTELTGCAKGQATAAVARGDVDPDSETLEDDLAPYIEKCSDEESDEESDEDSDEESDEACSDDAEGDEGYPEGTEESGDESSEGCDYKNHGEKVSTFVHETELEGCAKGQATAAVARGDVDPDSDTLDDDLADYIAKCDKDQGEADDEYGEDDEDDDESKGQGKAKGKDKAEKQNKGKAKGRP